MIPLLVTTLLSHIMLTEGAVDTPDYRLLHHLFSNHSRYVRPVTHPSIPVNATFGMEVIQILGIDDRKQLMTIKVWIFQTWTNMLMKWDPSRWGGVEELMVHAGDVWVPDIVLYTAAGDGGAGDGGMSEYKTEITMYANGLHYWSLPAVFTSTCAINVEYFPFDRQLCTMKFGSWRCVWIMFCSRSRPL